jgi:hypothetical protein
LRFGRSIGFIDREREFMSPNRPILDYYRPDMTRKDHRRGWFWFTFTMTHIESTLIILPEIHLYTTGQGNDGGVTAIGFALIFPAAMLALALRTYLLRDWPMTRTVVAAALIALFSNVGGFLLSGLLI